MVWQSNTNKIFETFQGLLTKFLKLFKVYYNKKCPLKEISLNGKKIPFEDTECFYNLLKKNKGNEKKLIETAEAVYLNN